MYVKVARETETLHTILDDDLVLFKGWGWSQQVVTIIKVCNVGITSKQVQQQLVACLSSQTLTVLGGEKQKGSK